MSNDNEYRIMGFIAKQQEMNTEAMVMQNGETPKDPPLTEVYSTPDKDEALRLLRGGFFTKEVQGEEDQVFLVREILAPRDADLSDVPRRDLEYEEKMKRQAEKKQQPIRKDG